MRIERHKFAQKFLTIFGLLAVIFITILASILGWNFNWINFAIFLAIIAGENALFGLLYFILRKSNWGYYIIDEESISLFIKEQKVFELAINKVLEIRYIRIWWMFLVQFGSGYCLFKYYNPNGQDKRAFAYPDGHKAHAINMSLKQAKQVEQIINKKVEIK